MTRREIYTLSHNDVIIGPGKRFARFLKFDNFVRGRPKRLLLEVGASGALESYSIDDIAWSWRIATPNELLLYVPEKG